jgi:MYXO-CTERM domain-containing protein
MKTFVVASALALSAASGSAFALPAINGAILNTRIFNDNPGSTLVTVNNYPSLISFSDSLLNQGFANRHNFRLSADGGATAAPFANTDAFQITADVTLAGVGNGEGGLQVSPWWSPNVDGQFNLRTSDGEVAIFGGRLPFYSFTASQGVTYVKGTTVTLGIQYDPRNVDAGLPGQIQYSYGALKSPWIPFDAANPSEAPTYGAYGILNMAQVGGFVQALGGPSGANSLSATFGSISVTVPTPGAASLAGLAGLVAFRRRRTA